MAVDIIHFGVTFNTQTFKVALTIVGLYSIFVVGLHIVMVETILYLCATSFTSKLFLCTVSK